MSTRLLGHYLHPILVVFPLGLFTTSLIFDLICLATGNLRFGTAAYWMIAAGIFGAVVAAPFGTIDWFDIPAETRAKRVGLFQRLAVSVMFALFVVCWLLRGVAPAQPTALSITLSIAGVTSAAIGGWLGGKLVERLGMGVHPDLRSDAPNSLTERDARQSPSVGSLRDRFFGGPKPAH